MKKTIIAALLTLTVGAFSSCEDFLIEEPVLKQSNELTFST